jgi:hypothetical protein
MTNPNKILIKNAGVYSSNGEYVFSDENTYISNNNHIEKTADGWFLVDGTINDQTYMFDFNFENVYAVGDCIEPVPEFELFFDV